MFWSRVLALACLAVMTSVAAHAEADTAASPVSPLDALDARPHIAAAAVAASEKAAVEEPASPTEKAADKAADNKPAESNQEAAKPAPPPPPTLTAKVDLGLQTMIVSENGDVKYTWPISSGAADFPTPRGTFHPQWLAKMWYSRKYDNAPMPNAVFINGGVAIHATQHVSSLGRPASHGCIRLAPGNAKTFYNLVQRHGLKLTRVSVYGTPKWRAPAIASRDQPQRYRTVNRDNQDSWFSTGRTYRQVPYDQGYTQRRYRQVPSYSKYSDVPRYYYRRPGGDRYVYVQRPQRRYYYNSYGYGYGGGW